MAAARLDVPFVVTWAHPPAAAGSACGVRLGWFEMGTYVLMRILESAPRRYDRGIRLLTLGGVDRARDRLASRIVEGQRVLDLGCGTGAFTLCAARRGATVKGIDISAQMLEIAGRRVQDAGLVDRVELVESGVAELDGETAGSYDAVSCILCYSELSADERHHTVVQTERILKPGGLVLVADEVVSRRPVIRALQALVRAPLVALTNVLTQQTTRPVRDLGGSLTDAGFVIVSARSGRLGSFVEVVARKPGETEG